MPTPPPGNNMPKPVQHPATPNQAARPSFTAPNRQAPNPTGALPPKVGIPPNVQPRPGVPLPPAANKAGVPLPPKSGVAPPPSSAGAKPAMAPPSASRPPIPNVYGDSPAYQKPISLSEIRPVWNPPNEGAIKKSQIAVVSLLSAFIVMFAALIGVLWFTLAPPSIVELGAPSISLSQDETKLQWQEIENARWYEVFVNNQFVKNTMQTEFLISEYNGTALLLSFKVRASKNGIYGTSDFSEPIEKDLREMFTSPQASWNGAEQQIEIFVLDQVHEYEIYESDVLIEQITLPDDFSESSFTFSVANFLTQDYGKKFVFQIKAKENEFGKDSDFSVVEHEYFYTIPNPVIVVNEQTASWTMQKGALHYEVVLNGNFAEPTTINNTLQNEIILDLNALTSGVPGYYNIVVKSVGKDEYNSDSDFSESSDFIITGQYSTPTGLFYNAATKMLSWNNVTGAENYSIYIDDVLVESNAQNPYDMTAFLLDGYSYQIQVQVNNNAPMVASDLSAKLNVICPLLLSTPQNLQIDSNKVVHWDAVALATAYTLQVDSTQYTISSSQTSYDLSAILVARKNYTIYVRANGNGVTLIESGPSSVISYANQVMLGTPQNVRKEGVQLRWNAVTHAGSYLVSCFNGLTLVHSETVTANSVGLANFVLDDDSYYEFFVTALPAVGVLYDLQSAPSEAFGVYYTEITTPTNLTYNTTTKTLHWDEMYAAGSFAIAVNNTIYTTTNNYYSLATILGSNDIIVQTKVSAVSLFNGNLSDYTDNFMVNNTPVPVPGYTDRYFFYEKWNDYKITSTAELDLLAWYLRTVQASSVQIMCDYTPVVSYSADISASMLKYGETAALTSWTNITVNGSLVSFNIAYNGVVNASNDDAQIVYNSATKSIARSEATRTRDDTFNNFYINQNIHNEVLALNSDHLFIILQSNAKPIFGTANAQMIQAQTVYQNMLQIMREIINNDFTEYEKVLAIYDWMIVNTSYDFETFSNDGEPTIAENHCFYLEGVFLNPAKRLAVCDGLAKAFVAMCRIEGIEAIKITGDVVGLGGHAWNKVNLQVPGQASKQWFFLDPTFDNQIINSGTEVLEIIMHSYFLVTDDQAADFSGRTYLPNERMYNPAAVTTFNVFDYLNRDYTVKSTTTASYDTKIDSRSELTGFFTYFTGNSALQSIEFSLEYSFADLHTEFVQAGWGANWTYIVLPRHGTYLVFKDGIA